MLKSGDLALMLSFYQNIVVSCNWGNWNPWGQCSKGCGGGQQSRTRNKLNEASTVGMNCQGGLTENKSCNTQRCKPTECCALKIFSHCVPCLG